MTNLQKATAKITIDIAPNYVLTPQLKCQKTYIYQRLIQRFLEDCKLHEISLGLDELQHLTEAFLEQCIRTSLSQNKNQQESQKTNQQHELIFPIYEDLMDIL